MTRQITKLADWPQHKNAHFQDYILGQLSPCYTQIISPNYQISPRLVIESRSHQIHNFSFCFSYFFLISDLIISQQHIA